MKPTSLDHLRDRLKKKDEKIVELLNGRARISLEIGDTKKREGLDIYDPAQENRIYARLNELNEGPLSDRALKDIFTEILSSSRALQAPASVAYLGPEASFTHAAAQSHFGRSALFSPRPTIFDVFDQVERNKADWGVVPVENSLEGAVKLTLDRLIATPLHILGEIFLRINHSLVSKGSELDGLKRIYSHPQALAQCQEWIRKNLPHCSLHETDSTAKAARKVLEDEEGAAIASSNAAALYRLTVISEGIEDNPSNVTRFLVIGRDEVKPTGKDKTSILMGTRHMPGALYSSLKPFAQKEINLMKIESYPIKGTMWEYLFFVDFDGHLNEDKIRDCLEDLGRHATLIKILGSYPMGDPQP
jgi:chorismate mutase/prephenate dehydratase